MYLTLSTDYIFGTLSLTVLTKYKIHLPNLNTDIIYRLFYPSLWRKNYVPKHLTQKIYSGHSLSLLFITTFKIHVQYVNPDNIFRHFSHSLWCKYLRTKHLTQEICLAQFLTLSLYEVRILSREPQYWQYIVALLCLVVT